MASPSRERDEAVRRLRRARRRVGGRPGRLAHRAARPERRRQVHAAARHRRARGARRGHACSSTARTRRRPARKRGVGFVFQHYAPFKHMTVRDNVAFGLKIRKRPKDEIERARRRAARARAPGGLRRPLSVAALRRAAPAHGAGAGARGGAQGAAPRRAVRRARRDRARGAARLAAAAPRRDARDHRLRDARPGGGHGGRRADRGLNHGRDRAGGLARATSTTARPTSS